MIWNYSSTPWRGTRLLRVVGLAALAGSGRAAAQDPVLLVDAFKKGGYSIARPANVPFGMTMCGPAFGQDGITFFRFSGAHVAKEEQNHVMVAAGTAGVPSAWPVCPTSGERLVPGYYSAMLPGGTKLEATSTTRASLLRFTFPTSTGAVFIAPKRDPDTRRPPAKGTVTIEGNTIRAKGNKNSFYDAGFYVHLDAAFNRQPRSLCAGDDDGIRNGTTQADGPNPYGCAVFATDGDSVVLVKIGMSYVSEENARLNREQEMPGWDFESYRLAAEQRWRGALGHIAVEGGTEAERTVFYTNLFRTMFHCNVFSDVNSEYAGFDKLAHRADGYTRYANYSGWDIYHCWIQLVALLFPDRVSDMAWSLVEAGVECGALPRWTGANKEYGPMEGDPAQMIITNAYMFGANSFDVTKALEVMERNANTPRLACQDLTERPGLTGYLKRGYVAGYTEAVPCNTKEDECTKSTHSSMTIQYCIGDFCLSRMFALREDQTRHARYLSRAQNWKHLFDPATKSLQGRAIDGSIVKGSFSEGNAAQYTWMVPHNIGALFRMMGGEEAAAARLDTYHTRIGGSYGGEYACLGNETSLGTPYLYNWAGQPWKTQALVRRALVELHYRANPGDDDLGSLSSWCVWAMLGLYPSISGVGGLSIASPVFPKATITMGGDRTLIITAQNAAQDAPYVQSLTVNGGEWPSPWLPLSALDKQVNSLHFVMGRTPNRNWGTEPRHRPPSFDAEPGPVATARDVRAPRRRQSRRGLSVVSTGVSVARHARSQAGMRIYNTRGRRLAHPGQPPHGGEWLPVIQR